MAIDTSPFYHKLTDEEKEKLLFLSMRGGIVWDTDGGMTILMGLEAFNEYEAYKKELQDKYYTGSPEEKDNWWDGFYKYLNKK